MRLEHSGDALVLEGVDAIQRLGRRRCGELHELGGPVEPQQTIREVVRRYLRGD